MPVFGGQNNIKEYTPKTVKFSGLYKYGTGGEKLNSSVTSQVKNTLAKSGYNSEKIDKIINQDTGISAKEMKNVTKTLNQNKVYGFSQNPESMLKKYLIKERVKSQNIASIRKENMMEARTVDLNAKPGTAPQLAKGPVSHIGGSTTVRNNRVGGDKASTTTFGSGKSTSISAHSTRPPSFRLK